MKRAKIDPRRIKRRSIVAHEIDDIPAVPLGNTKTPMFSVASQLWHSIVANSNEALQNDLSLRIPTEYST